MDLTKKQKLMILILWFIIAYLIMWYLGGACTSLFVSPSDAGKICVSKTGLQGISDFPVLGPILSLFLPFYEWGSLLYWFAPIAGFVFAFYGIKWWNKYFETKEASSLIFPILMVVVLLAGFYINLSWYYGESAALNSNNQVQYSLYFCFENDDTACNQTVSQINQEFITSAQSVGATQIKQFLTVNYWKELKESIFLTFIIGAIAAWLPLFVYDTMKKREEKK